MFRMRSLLLACALSWVQGFLLPQRGSRRGAWKASLDDALEANSFTATDTEQLLKELVQRGLAFTQSPAQGDKVPGCMANVHVCTTLKDDGTVSVEGNADALVSRGLLAVVVALTEGLTSEEVLQLDSSSLATRLGLRNALSPGRNDGLASMWTTIQQQIRRRLDPPEESPLSSTVPSTRPRVALLLSGGVDSSVALRLLLNQSYQVTAFYLRIWLEDELAHLGQCPWEDDFRICQAVCEQAGVPLESISLQNEYKESVMAYTVHEAEQGRTPNPDVWCNRRIKFGCFYDSISWDDFDYVASGHYAQVGRGSDGVVRLHRAPDPVKDQSYFLCTLTQEQLQRVLFPIGHLEKFEVRALAQEYQLPNRDRPDSQGLCFLGKVKFDEFLEAYLGDRPGPIVDAATGESLGTHRGIWYHTVGQRKGIGKVLDPLATSRGPWYVVAKDPAHNAIYCSNQYDEDAFSDARSEFTVENIHWIIGVPPQSTQLTMKIRHGPRLVTGSLSLSGSGDEGDIRLDRKDSGLAPGQFVAFYEDDECLGAGVISERHWAKFLLESPSLVGNAGSSMP